MAEFIVGSPLVTFINYQTKESIQMNYSIDYSKFEDEIEIEYASVCLEQYFTLLKWLEENNVILVELNFNTYIGSPEENTVKTDDYKEQYVVTQLYKPYVKNTGNQIAGVFTFKFKVRN